MKFAKNNLKFLWNRPAILVLSHRSFYKNLGFQLNQTTTCSIYFFYTSNYTYNLNTKTLWNKKLFNIKFDKKIRELQLYYRANFKIQNALAVHFYKCLRGIHCTYNLDIKMSSIKKCSIQKLLIISKFIALLYSHVNCFCPEIKRSKIPRELQTWRYQDNCLHEHYKHIDPFGSRN